MDFFDKYGFVVFRNVISHDEVEDTRKEFFQQFDHTNESETTAFLNGPQNPFSKMGIIGMQPDIRSVTQLCNRQNKRVYKAFEYLYEDSKLIVDHDRIGAMRPTVLRDIDNVHEDVHSTQSGSNVSASHFSSNSSNFIRKEWQTINNWLHLDCDPSTGEISVGSFDTSKILESESPHDFESESPFLLQGFLTLSDTPTMQNGGFLCVPGSHKVTKEWARNLHKEKYNALPFQGQLRPNGTDDPFYRYIYHVTTRPGSLVIWNAFTFHSNHPNQSDQWRLVQHVRMYPSEGTRYKPLVSNECDYPEEFERSVLTPLGKRLFGIEPW